MKSILLHKPKPHRSPHLFGDLKWNIEEGDTWVVYGAAGSGKSLLKDILTKRVPLEKFGENDSFTTANFTYSEVSPTIEKELIDRENYENDSEFTEGGLDQGRTAYEILIEHIDKKLLTSELIEALNLSHLLHTPYRHLSNGETRKVLVLRSILTKTDLIFLDSPFEGLDQSTYKLLKSIIQNHCLPKTQLYFLNSWEQAPKLITGVLFLEKNKTPRQLSYLEAEEIISKNSTQQTFELPLELKTGFNSTKANPLISLKNIDIHYGEKYVFNDFSWKMSSNESWLFSGPNGAGKTNLLQIIHADHPQSYGQDIQLFGIQRGQGESIWDIKSHIGFVSVDFQRNFPTSMTGLAMVISGFHDSMGLYRKPSQQEIDLSQLWLSTLKLDHLKDQYLSKMSWGEIRMLMIARALVKKPDLLILDEPCQGLDQLQKKAVLELIDLCSTLFDLNLIYVTHHKDDILKCITHQLQWTLKNDGNYQHDIISFKT